MFHSQNDCYTLSNGVKVPCIGYGTWQTAPGQAVDCVKTAVRAGYTHIDTAWIYGNEPEVGEGLRASGAKREDIFITTKHWVTERGYEKTKAAIDASLKNLKLDYIDLYLVHWPCVEKVRPDWEEINAETWRGFEEAYKAGKLRAIGVSNYEAKHLNALFCMCSVKPMVNQIEFHPGHTQWENVRFAQGNGMLVEAWSPLGSGAVLKDARLAEIAAKYGKNTAQLCIRLALDCGVLPLPKSTNPARIAENLNVFDFTLTEEDKQALLTFPELGFSGFSPEDAPADAIA